MASRIPPQVIDEIREKTDIANVISQYVQLKKTGKNYLGLCPFHSEKTPSFTVAEDKQIFYCFGCGKGGNVFQFFQELESISFPEAIKRVAEMEQIPFSYEIEQRSGEKEFFSEHASLLKMHEKAAALYHHLLMNAEVGKPALAYLEQRGLTSEQIELFQIGFAPDVRELLSETFRNDSFLPEEYQESGLFNVLEDGKRLDRFYNRIMFPIRDEHGRVIAFSGRILAKGKEQAKYLNSPETKIFNKSQVLYNFDLARATIRKTNEVFLFEGFMDVIAAFLAGIKGGVASMGTSFTKEQLLQLSRVAKDVVVAYDGDQPGQAAMHKAIREIRAHTSLEVQVLLLPESLDPDEYVRKYGEEAFVQLAMHGRSSVFEFQENYLKFEKNLANETERIAYIYALLEELAQVSSVLEQEVYLGKIVKEFPEFSLETLRGQLEGIKSEKRGQLFPSSKQWQPVAFSKSGVAPARKFVSVQEKAERRLLVGLMKFQNPAMYGTKFQEFTFHFPVLQQLYESYLLFLEIQNEFREADFLTYLTEDDERNLFSELFLLNQEEVVSEEEFKELLGTIRREELKQQIQERVLAQQAAKRIGNTSRELELALEIIDLKRRV